MRNYLYKYAILTEHEIPNSELLYDNAILTEHEIPNSELLYDNAILAEHEIPNSEFRIPNLFGGCDEESPHAAVSWLPRDEA